jgi:large subunit ribosomal protein L24
MYLKQGDNVVVIAGKDKGKHGKVERIFRDRDMVVVNGVNIKKRHQKSQHRGENAKGQIVDVAAPIHVSNVALVDPKTNKPTRVRMKIEANGNKVRIGKSGDKI